MALTLTAEDIAAIADAVWARAETMLAGLAAAAPASASSDADYVLTQGDLPGATEFTLRDDTGTIVDLTTATGVTFTMRALDDTIVVDAQAAAVVAPATSGKVTYTWQAADVAASGLFAADFEVTFTGGRVVTFPTSPKLYVRIVATIEEPSV